MKLVARVKLLPSPEQAQALQANLKAQNLGRKGSARRARIESTPICFRAHAAQPFDDRCLSWQMDARTVSIWTVSEIGRASCRERV